MQWRTKRANGNREPEFRLPVALPGFFLILIGIVEFFVMLNNTPAGRWNITPLIGGYVPDPSRLSKPADHSSAAASRCLAYN